MNNCSRHILIGAALAAMLAGPLWGQTPSASPTGKYRPETLSIDQINQAVKRARDALSKDPALQPRYEPIPESFYRGGRYNVSQEIRNMVGNHALICWALLASGDSYQNPVLARRLQWVLSSDQSLTYDRGIRLAMLAQLPHDRWGNWVRRDVMWMLDAMTDKGNFDEDFSGKRSTAYGDNANGQYGALGLWVYEQAGYSLKKQVWEAIDKYWKEAIIPTPGEDAAGWAVYSPQVLKTKGMNMPLSAMRVSGPMTAGAVAILFVTERYLRGGEMLTPEKTLNPHLRKGLRWLDENFTLDDKEEATDKYYYYWTVQRVGHATGYRSFHGIDWFREITARMLNEQQPDGTWTGDKGRLLSTGFALLYLSEAFDPVAIGKIRFSGRDRAGKENNFVWNTRPHDIWNFTDYLSDEYEYATGWQIVQLSMPVYGLRETPVLWLATSGGFDFSDEEIAHLREYLNTGGILVTNPDENNPQVGQSIKKLNEKLFPDQPLKNLPRDHDLYSLHQKVTPGVGIQMVDNGIRPLWIHFTRDIGASLQIGDSAKSESFRILSNIYLYAVGLNPRRPRLQDSYVYEQRQGTRTINCARIKYEGRYDPEPAALDQLHNLMANEYNINLAVQTVDGKSLSAETRIAFLTTTGDGTLSDADAAALGKWVAAGGLLWIDAAGGSKKAGEAAEAMLKKIAPDQAQTPIALDHPLISGHDLDAKAPKNRWVSFRPYALRTMGPVNTPRLLTVEYAGRLGIIYSAHDITCGMAGLEHWGIFGYSVPTARNLAINSVLFAAKK